MHLDEEIAQELYYRWECHYDENEDVRWLEYLYSVLQTGMRSIPSRGCKI
jgi:hypothetical protein